MKFQDDLNYDNIVFLLILLIMYAVMLSSCAEIKRKPPTRAVCVIVDTGRVLLLRERSNEAFDLPGGTIESSEGSRQTAVREVKEETGLDVLDLHYQFTYGKTVVYDCSVLGSIQPYIGDPVYDVGYYDLQSVNQFKYPYLVIIQQTF